ncbi:hypothetical protein GCM10010260_50950 [Streptomyces filipinensis]|uniref:Uncharacterized protein n=1 Tax=Streptomyces filipinensis TaxID=66887 RepID=A0A918MC95_9ACTN|nr:hypothetical protein [Streptomyces filipinensis]GGV07101.1 hypothetical protein GCM10010260_50950 [Streptomyces filipinensis]
MLRLPALLARPTWSLYADDQLDQAFYAIASVPRLARGPDGAAVLSLIKYRSGTDKLNGGIIELQTDLALRPEERDEALAAARAHGGDTATVRAAGGPQLATPLWLDGTASLQLLDPAAKSDERTVHTQPSLSGNNPAVFQAALTQEGATVQWDALRSARPSLQASYRLRAMARIPDGTVHAYARSADVTALWAQATALPDPRGALAQASAAGVDVLDWPADGDPELREAFISWGWEWLAPWLPPHGTPPTSDIDAVFTGAAGLPWPFDAAGTLDPPDLTRDEGCFLALDLSDPIFQQRRTVVRCNADFTTGMIAAVTARIAYGDQRHDAVFTDNDTVDQVTWTVDPALGRTIAVRPVVSFAASSATLELPELRTDNQFVLLSVDDVGRLTVDLSGAALDWSTVHHVEAGIRYQDSDHGVGLVEDTLELDASRPSQRYERTVYAPVNRPYDLRLVYTLTDGQTVVRDWSPQTGRTVLVPAPFDRWLTLRLRAAGWSGGISAFQVDLEAEDGTGRTSRNTVRLTPETGTADWRTGLAPAATGRFRYRVTTLYADGHSTVDPWKDGEGSRTLDVGPAPSRVLDVTVVADLVDFTVVKLVKTTLRHPVPTGEPATHEMVFAPGRATSESWQLPLSDDGGDGGPDYTVTSTFYLRDGDHRSTPETPGTDPIVVLRLPA